MTTYGLTALGFSLKRLQIILAELKDACRSGFSANGVTVVTGDESGFGIFCGIIAKPLAEIWELAQAVHASQYAGSGAGASLDNVLALVNLTRKAATASTAWQLFTGDSATVIPSGSLVEHDASGKRFATTADVTIDEDEVLGATIQVGAAALGASFTVTVDGHDRTIAAGTYEVDENVAAALAAEIDRTDLAIIAVDQTARTFTVDFDVRSYFAIGKRCKVTGATANVGVYTVADLDLTDGDTVVTVAEAISAATVAGYLHGHVEATASGDTVILTGYDLPDGAGDASDFAFSLALSTTVGGALAFTELEVVAEVECTEDAAIEALAASLTIIATPVSGWTSTTNLIGADEGNLEETDVEARQRRAKSLKIHRLETVLAALTGVDAVRVYYNDTGTADGEGRPGHSIECVVDGGDDDEIAQAIYETKAGGIQTWGNSVQVITDSQGITRTVLFSRPTDVDIYVAVTVASLYDEEDLPADASGAIKDAIVTYGGTFVGGANVIAKRIEAAIALSVPGLDSFSVNIGIAASPGTATTIAIAADEIARFDEDRITVAGV